MQEKKEKYNQRNRTNKIYNLDIVSPYMNTNDFWEMPIISKDNYIPERLIGFNEALTSKAQDACVHFFLDDYQFERIWKEPRRYVDALKRFSGVFSPDFSLYLDMPTSLSLRVDSMRGTYGDEQGLKHYNDIMELKGKMSQQEIADTLGISKTIVNKMCCKTYKPYISNARYFSDIIREADWFEQI